MKSVRYGVLRSQHATVDVDDSFASIVTTSEPNFATTATSVVTAPISSPVPIVVCTAVVPKKMMNVESVSVLNAKMALVTIVSSVKSVASAAFRSSQDGTSRAKVPLLPKDEEKTS